MSAVAVFDLDRTLISGSSAEVFGQMLRDVGVELPSAPGQAAYFAMYQRFGEDPVTMRLARFASRLFAGESVTKVETAGRLAADVLASRITRRAREQIDHHQANGDKVLLATTAPHELAVPLAEAAGFDDVLCTRYRAIDGVYDGSNESRYLWGHDKAEGVAEWAGARAVDLARSAAYSHSWYDVPLLQLVGRPTAVNADLRLNVYARAKGWKRSTWRT